jgi:hypothetical protein
MLRFLRRERPSTVWLHLLVLSIMCSAVLGQARGPSNSEIGLHESSLGNQPNGVTGTTGDLSGGVSQMGSVAGGRPEPSRANDGETKGVFASSVRASNANSQLRGTNEGRLLPIVGSLAANNQLTDTVRQRPNNARENFSPPGGVRQPLRSPASGFPVQATNAGVLGQAIGGPVQSPNAGRLGATINRPGAAGRRRRRRRHTLW